MPALMWWCACDAVRCRSAKRRFTFVKMKDPEARRAALSLLARGAITISEAADLAGISRQLMRYWCKRARIDWQRIRRRRIAKAWRKAVNRPIRDN